MAGHSTRREFLQTAAAVSAGTLVASCAKPHAGVVLNERNVSLVFAHVTDIHVKAGAAADGMARAIRHAQSHPAHPAFLLNGGDAIYDALAVSAEETRAQWQLWQRTLAEAARLPIHHCIGNHDIWGWDRRSGAQPTEDGYGKKWALEAYGLERGYYSFDSGAWRFIVLDSCQPTGREDRIVYRPLLDDAQLEWLRSELAATPPEMYVCIVSHVPIASAAAYFYGPKVDLEKPWWLLQLLVHLDARPLKDLFTQHPNVKVCLSGHIHLVDELKYGGVTYYCNGAVCGDMWRGPHQECVPGYAIMRFFDDGTSEREYVAWMA